MQNNYNTSTGQLHQVVRIPNYTNVTVSGVLACHPWNGFTGGILVFRANGTVTVNASGFITAQVAVTAVDLQEAAAVTAVDKEEKAILELVVTVGITVRMMLQLVQQAVVQLMPITGVPTVGQVAVAAERKTLPGAVH